MWYYILDHGAEVPEVLESPRVLYDVRESLQQTVNDVVQRLHGLSWCDRDEADTIVLVTDAPGPTRVPRLFGVSWYLITKSNSGHALLDAQNVVVDCVQVPVGPGNV